MDIDVDVEQHWSDDERMDEDMEASGPSNPAESEVQMDHSDGLSHGGGDGDDEMMGDAPASGSGAGDIEIDMDAPTPKPAASAPAPQPPTQPVPTLPSGFASAFVPPVSPEKAGHEGSPHTPELEMRAATPGPSGEGAAGVSAGTGVAVATGSGSGGGDAKALAPPATNTGAATSPEMEMRPASPLPPAVPASTVPATANPDVSGVEVGTAPTAGSDETVASGNPLTGEAAAGVAGEAEGSSSDAGAGADYFSSGLPPASADVTDAVEAEEAHPEEMPAQPSPKRSRSRSREPTQAGDAEGSRSEMGDHTDAEYDEEEEYYDGDFFITPASLPPIIIHLPASSRHSPAPAAAGPSSFTTPALGRALFSPIESDPQQLPVWLKGRQLELAEASLIDVWSAIRAECAKEGLIPSAGEGMIITEQDMGLRMSEDDVNLQSITFIELLHLHQGCELPEPVQLHLTWESGRFITRFNAIQSELAAVQSRSTSEEMEEGHGEYARSDAGGEGEEDGEAYEEDYVEEDYEYIGHEDGEAEAEAEDGTAEKAGADRGVSRERASPKRDDHDEKAQYAESQDEAKTTKDLEREHPNWADARVKPTEELYYQGTENKHYLKSGSATPAAAEASVPAPAAAAVAAPVSPTRDEKGEPAGGAEGAEGASLADGEEHAAEYGDDDEGEVQEEEEVEGEGEGEYDDDEREEDDNGEGHEYEDEGGEWAGDADTNDDPDPTAESNTDMTHVEPPRLVAVLPKKDADALLSAPTSAGAASPSASAAPSLALPVDTDPKDEIALKHAALGSVLAQDGLATPLVSPGISAVGSPAPGSAAFTAGPGTVPPPVASGAVTPLLSTEPELDSAAVTLTPSEDDAARALAEDALAFEKPSVIPEEASEEVVDDVPVPGGVPLDEIELKLQEEADAAVLAAGEEPALADVAGVGGGVVPERELGEVGLVGSQDFDELETPAAGDGSALDAETAEYSYEEYDETVGVTADGDGEEEEEYGSTEETLDDDDEGKAFGNAEAVETTTGLGTDTIGGLTSFGDEPTTEAERDVDAVTTVSKRSYDSDGDDGEGSKRARTG
ncbi:hypothetical protein IAT38_000417 [Cryptococcus sp. DSM 104549]